MREYTPEELGLTAPTAPREYTPQELGLAPVQKEYTPEELGLVPPKADVPAAEPTIFQRVKDIAASPIEAIMGENAFKESTTPTQRPMAGSARKGIINLEQSLVQNQLASLTELQEADKLKYGKNYENAPSNALDAITARDKAITDKLKSVAEMGLQRKALDERYGVFELAKGLKDTYAKKEYKDAGFVDQLKMIGSTIADNPSGIPGWIASVGVESLPQSMATVVAALAARTGGMGTKATAIAGGSGSAFMEFGGQYAELRAEGLDHKEAWEKAGVKSGVIGLFDAVSFMSAGSLASKIVSNIEKGAFKDTVKQVGKGLGIQALYGGAGEALGAIAIDQKVDPGAVLEEMVGEVFGAPVEAASTYSENKAAQKAATNVPPQTTPNAPTTETTALTPAPQQNENTAKQQFFEEAQTRYRELGLSKSDSQKLANEDLKEAQDGGKFVPGAYEPSVSTPDVPTEVRGTTAGAATDQLGGVGGIETPTAVPTGREEVQPSALDVPTISPLYKAALDTLEGFKTQLETASLEEAPVLEKKIADMNIYLTTLEAEGKNIVAPKAAAEATPAEVVTAQDQAPVAPEAKVVTRGKRGRPAVELTPEQQAEKAQVRKDQQSAGRTAVNQANKIEKVLATEFNPDSYENPEAAQVALNTRRQALEDAYRLSIDKAQKNKTAGTRAAAALAKVNPQERQLAKDRYEAKQKVGETARSEAIAESTSSEDNPKFESFTNATQAVDWIAKNGNAFESFLAKRLRPFLQGVNIVIVRDPEIDVPASFRDDFNGANGMYYESKKRRTIYLDINGGINNTVFLHEALHGATLTRINNYLDAIADGREPSEQLADAVEQLNSVMKRAREFQEELADRGMEYPGVNEFARVGAFTNLKEFVTYGMTSPTLQDFLMQIPGMYAGQKTTVKSSLFNNFVQSVRSFFKMGEEHNSAFQDLIIVTDKLLSAPTEGVTKTEATASKAKKVDATISKDMQKIQLSNDAFESADTLGDAIKNHKFEDYVDLLNARYEAMSGGFIAKLLYGLQTVDILRWKGNDISGLKEVDQIQQEMSALRTQMSAAAAKKADALGAFIRKNGMKVLGNTMHLARLKKVTVNAFSTASGDSKPLADVLKDDPIYKKYDALVNDPTLDKKEKAAFKGKRTIRENGITEVYKSWQALGKQKGGHDTYLMVRDFYRDNYRVTRSILNEQIDALPIDADAKSQLLKSVRLMQERNATTTEEDKGEIEGLEDDIAPNMDEDYFPFKREGKFWLRVNGGPTGRELYLFESATARNQFQAKRSRQLNKDKNDPDTFVKGDDLTALRKDYQDSSVMLQKMFATIDEAETKQANVAGFKEDLKDQLYQVYLMTLPERSFRKQFLHSENVTGFSADVFRNFKSSAISYSNQIPKLKYAGAISAEIQRARDSLEGMPTDERAKLELFINEIDVRAQDEINPPDPGKVAGRLNQFAFLWLLTSPASAATQMASVPIMVMPSLNAEYGYGSSAKKFAKYLPVWKSVGITQKDSNGVVDYTAPSIGNSSMVKSNPILQRAFEAAVERQITTLTNTSVLTGNARTAAGSYSNIAGTTTRFTLDAMSALFNGAERMSREFTYMMVFELEYAKTKDFQKSVDKAVDMTHELLGRYDNFNRPRILRNFAGRTVGQFKQYAVFMTSFFVRNASTIFQEGLLKEEGRQAMSRLTGVLVMGGMFHGLVGMPLYSVICATIDSILDGDDEERKLRRAKNPLTADSSNLRFRYEWLPQNFGTITFPGVDGRQHRLSDVLEKGAISALTDVNIGSRTSFDGMWFREAKPGKNWMETVQNYIIGNLGPAASTGLNMVGAIDDFVDGKIGRGLEKLVPALFKGSLVAGRLATEGAETKGGADMLKRTEINDLNIIASALGFQSARLARIQEKNFEFQKQQTEAVNSRTALLRRLSEAVYDQEGDKAKARSILKDIQKFNRRYPIDGLFIEGDTIDNSLEAYANKRGMTYRGQYISDKMLPYLAKPSKAAAPLE